MKPPSFYLYSILRAGFAIPLYVLSFLIPRDPNRIVIGAWQGKLYSDNSKYFMLYTLKHTNIKITWIGEKHIEQLLPQHPNLTFATKDSLKAIWAALRAKTWIYCWGLFFDISEFPLRGKALVINLWHGIPLKYVGRKTHNGRTAQKDSFCGRLYSGLMHMGGTASYLATSSDIMTDMLADGVPNVFNTQHIIKSGMPRNDFLVHNVDNRELYSSLKQQYAKILGFDKGKKIVTYLPTHRNDGQYAFAFFDATADEQTQIKRVLDANNAILIEKHHFLTLKNFPNTKQSICSISIPADQQTLIDVQELLLISDVLICDYTSAYYDFSLLSRPIIHYVYDYAHYKTKDSGIAFPLEDHAAGPIAESFDALLSELSSALASPKFKPRPEMKTNLTYETGHACETILSFIKRHTSSSNLKGTTMSL